MRVKQRQAMVASMEQQPGCPRQTGFQALIA